jgi:hypothetical protein
MSKQKQDTVAWEKPPVPRDTQYDWAASAGQWRARPGEWAKVFDRDRTSLANAIRINGIKDLLPSHGFEVQTANNRRVDPELGDRRSCTMFLRYNPDKDTTVSTKKKVK